MRLDRALLLVLAVTTAGGGAGLGVGYALGRNLPGYYRAVFHLDGEGKDPLEVGLGLGLTQGLAAGLAVSLVLVLASSWSGRGSRQAGQILAELRAIREAVERPPRPDGRPGD